MADIVIRPSMKFIKAGYGLVILIILGLVFLRAYFEPQLAQVSPATLLIVAVVLLLFPAKNHLQRQCTRITIAGDKLRYETGVLSKTTRTLQLSKVQHVRVDQSLGQRILGVGTLSIETAGEASRLAIRNVDGPQAVADRIMDAAQKGASPGL